VFLLDEPLSNLDAALRGEMRAELTRLHARLRVATLYVTHDQVEAMTMGDRIGVMCDGRLQQVDVPETIYDHPVNLFVATFIGSPKMNIIPGRVVERGVNTVLECLGKRFGIRDVLAAPSTSDILLGVRPEDVHWLPVEDARSSDAISGVVEVVEPMGAEAFVTVLCNGERIKARFPSRSGIQVGDAVDLAFAAERMQIFDAQTSVNLKVRQAGPKYAEKEEAV
jgi:multiple sugar transport system ATP-binding protein